MKRYLHTLLLGVSLALFSFPALASEEKKNEIRNSVNETLAELYQLVPGSQSAVAEARGYAVFNNASLKIFVAGGGTGKGIAVNNANGHETFMKMVEVQAGLGMGVKRFSLIFVFETEDAFNSFVESGWEFGGQATAAAKSGDEGEAFTSAVSISPGVWLYQITDDGIALELTAKGTKYFKDDDLN